MPSRSAQQCQQRLFNPPELRNLLACNLDLMPALRTRVPQQDASAGASPDVPHDFFTWKSCPLAQSWIDELPHCVPHLGGCPRAQRRALRTTRVAQWHTGQVGCPCCRAAWGGGGTLECSHCLWKVGENSKYTACLCSLKAGSCIRRGEELKYLQTALSSPCSPKLSSRTSRGQKSFSTAQSWTHEAPLSWTDTGKCWVSPVPPKVHLSLTQCQTPNFLKEISGEGGGNHIYLMSQLLEGPWEDLSEGYCAGWTWALRGVGDVSLTPAAWTGVMCRAVEGLQADVWCLVADHGRTWARLLIGIPAQTDAVTSTAAPRYKVGFTCDAGLNENNLWRSSAQESFQLCFQIHFFPSNNLSYPVRKSPIQPLF